LIFLLADLAEMLKCIPKQYVTNAYNPRKSGKRIIAAGVPADK